ncbi:MAG TPA: terephthalate dihydrodiol dehydrogenase [Oxalobacteraceae bacterium]|nr:terephthalate dihydrodiol dehydrogenase [Oxalobacteraceae bacterium]
MRLRDKIAVAIGDPNGIGPEIAVKAAARFACSDLQPVLVGDEFVIQEYARRHAGGLPLSQLDGADTDGGIAFVPVNVLAHADFKPGTVSPAAGRATVAYVAEAVRLAKAGAVRAIVGCPHSETAINGAGIPFSGYPQLIARLAGTPENRVFLMLVAAGLRIAHVTLHESVRQALGRIDIDLVTAAGIAAVDAVRKLGVEQPRLGVFGINPHAGEGGLFGDDDERITKPAVQRLRSLGIETGGPVGADLLLGQRRHDVYLAMFHDQGHIPIKLLSPLRASALSIGTDLLFSSVGHGSAFDIAGKGVADPVSVIETLDLLHRTSS